MLCCTTKRTRDKEGSKRVRLGPNLEFSINHEQEPHDILYKSKQQLHGRAFQTTISEYEEDCSIINPIRGTKPITMNPSVKFKNQVDETTIFLSQKNGYTLLLTRMV